MAAHPIITLTTDFGLDDTYVGAMKGVILGIAPHARIVDLTHAVPPQNVVAGALALESVYHVFHAGTIHVVVVDPGVGTARRAVAVETERYRFVAPDNGVLGAALTRERVTAAVVLDNSRYHRHPVSATFHGRDVFAPAAAHLAAGVPLTAFGSPAGPFAALDLPHPVRRGSELEAHVVHVDRFGNLVTDLTADELADWLAGADRAAVTVRVGGATIEGIRATFGDVAPGAPVAYVGSGGRLEVGVRNASAQDALGLGVGGVVVVAR